MKLIKKERTPEEQAHVDKCLKELEDKCIKMIARRYGVPDDVKEPNEEQKRWMKNKQWY